MNTAKSTGTGTIRWIEKAPHCSLFYKEGIAFQIITTDNLLMACAIQQTGKYKVARVFIKNNSNENLDVIPKNFSLGNNPPIEFSHEGRSKTNTAKTLAYLSHGSYAPGQGYQAPLRSHSVMSGTVYGNQSAASYSGASSTVCSRRPSLVGLVAGHVAKQADELESLKTQAIKATTLFPGQQIAGCVIFEKKNIKESQNFSASLGQSTFVFAG